MSKALKQPVRKVSTRIQVQVNPPASTPEIDKVKKLALAALKQNVATGKSVTTYRNLQHVIEWHKGDAAE